MTATVTQDAEVGLWTPGALAALLVQRPELCQQLLLLLCERMVENHEIMKALYDKRHEILRRSSLA